MSSFRHPKLSAWERDEHEGHYQAELHGWTLRTVWSPKRGDRGYFGWEAKREEDDGESLSKHSEDHFAELAHAMSDAEDFARRDERRRAQVTARRAEESALAGDH